MILDKQLELSDKQAVTVTAVSTKVLNPVSDIGNGKPLFLVVTVQEAFAAAGEATLSIDLQDSANGSGYTSRGSIPAIPKASLVAGAKFQLPLPPGLDDFIRANYTVGTGPMTAGKLSAHITYGNEYRPAYPAA